MREGEKMREVGKGDERGGYEGRCEECVDSFLENSALKANKHMTRGRNSYKTTPSSPPSCLQLTLGGPPLEGLVNLPKHLLTGPLK